jgi:polar amino acid transport system substrate-binding protein
VIGRLAFLAALLFLAGAVSAGEGGRIDRILQRGRLIVGVKIDYPPWGAVAPDGRIVGIEPDLARNAADRLGVALELVPVTAGNRLQRLAQGRVDMVIATLGDTPARRATAGLVRPHYYASGVGLLAREDAPFADWPDLRGRPICLNEAAFFNRTLIERYGIEPVVFPSTREALLALANGSCAGWAFDDTVIGQLLLEPRWAGFRMALPSILPTPWSIAVRKDEEHGALGRFASDLVVDWHRSGLLVDLQARRGLPPSVFLESERARLSRRGAASPGSAPSEADAPESARPAQAFDALDGTGSALLLDALNRERLLHGVGLTLALSLVGVVGSLAVGVLLAWADHALGPGAVARTLRLPLRAFTAVARMTPPILQLYLVFFGLGGLLAASHGLAPSSFLVAALVLSLYAGATNAVLVRAALAALRLEHPQVAPLRLLPAAIDRCYEGLASTIVNIVKAAGLAGTIAVPELVSAVNAVLAESGQGAVLMTLLLVFYFLLVLAVMRCLRAGRGAVRQWAWQG